MTPQERATLMRDENQQTVNVPADLVAAPAPLAPFETWPDAEEFRPIDDQPDVRVIGYRDADEEYPVVVRLGRDPSRVFRFTVAESVALREALELAELVATEVSA